MSHTVMWFRDDLRLSDHPALLTAWQQASAQGGRVVGLYVVDPSVYTETAHYLWRCASLAALSEAMGGALVIRTGNPRDVVPLVAKEAGATAVHVTAATTPDSRQRDADVAALLEALGLPLTATGTGYVHGPGTVEKKTGGNYLVYTPFWKTWRDMPHPLPAPPLAKEVQWHDQLDTEPLPSHVGWAELTTPPNAGEHTAAARLSEFLDASVATYADRRDAPGVDATSRLSTHLAHGEIHPRTIIEAVRNHPDADSKGAEVFVKEVVWREFYGDVLWQHPHTATDYYRPEFAAMEYDSPDDRLRAWKFGQTGFPLVDAGMRQLRSTGWMHNRVRMVVASFLVKDLHIEWQHGAQWFERNLYDFDLASNAHGWQWTAGCGTDAAPYFRIFNPITQGLRFDPHGDYLREYLPELRHLPGKSAHEPWKTLDGYSHGYPQPMVDHSQERDVALARYEAIKKTS